MGKYVGSLRTEPFKQMKFKPLILKDLLIECGISQRDLMKITGHAKATINLTVNRGYIPSRSPEFRNQIQKFLLDIPAAIKWLKDRGLKVEDIWNQQGSELRMAQPAGLGKKIARLKIEKPILPGNPDVIINQTEVEMISGEAMKHFKVFRNPFIDDVQKDQDIFMSDEHRYIEAAMLDSARHGGFLAIIGEVGSGKSIMRRKVVEQLRKDGDVLVIFPQIVDKTRLNAASICDAIIMDISDQKPRMRLEQKTRQVHNLLLDRSKSGYRACLIVEEAHDLNPMTLKFLKRFYELEDGYKKLLGIILIGQPELKHFFNEAQHVEMREVIRRCQVAEIKGLNGNLKEYLSLKFKRVGADIEKIFDKEAVAALSKRLTTEDRNNKKISHAYPLMVNNYAAKAMNMAYEMGESKVTEQVVMAL